ncbi:MAG: hypothetical protein NZ898_05615 [Myxococcota bacterium]|nr:hypothetical protein [Myxococcota bacterium]MDW8362390.1 hypothetical protein [Myxococcales bacterium]
MTHPLTGWPLLAVLMGGVVAALAALTLTIRGGVPQLARLRLAVLGLGTDEEAPGTQRAAVVTLAATTTVGGTAVVVSTASAVAMGGTGVLFWFWSFAFLAAALRHAEAWLARTDAPGARLGASGSLAERLRREQGLLRGMGFVLGLLVPVTATLWCAGVLGAGARGVLSAASPDVERTASIAASLLAPLLAGLLAWRMRSPWMVVVAGVGGGCLLVAFVTMGLVVVVESGRALGTLARAASEALGGAPQAGAFSGAIPAEVLAAAAGSAVPVLLGPAGSDGALVALARATSTRAAAAASMLPVLGFAAIATLTAMALVGSGVYFERVPTSRPLDALVVHRAPFDSASQRRERERLYEGYLRVQEGELRDVTVALATERATIEAPRFFRNGVAADVALHVREGRVFRILAPDRHGVLQELDRREIASVTVSGRMLANGPEQLVRAAGRGALGPTGVRLLVVVLVLGATAACAILAFSAALGARPQAPAAARVALAVLVASGLGAGLWLPSQWTAAAVGVAAGLLGMSWGIALLARASDVVRLARSSGR